MATRSSRLTIVFVAVVVVALAAFFGIRTLWRTAQDHFTSSHCDIGEYQLDTDQASVASTMVGAVSKFKPALPERAAVLVLAAGLQESKLENLPLHAGDRDSVGVLQQRPSQGWGKVAGQPDSISARTKRLTDVGEATKEFLDQLVKVKGWQTLPLATAVQDVQISADGTAYAQHEQEAQALSDALRGARAAGITCDFSKPSKVAATSVVAAQARTQLGITTPVAGTHAVRVPGAHWQTASWFVANADRYGIEQVDYAGRRWTRSDGWKKRAAASSAAVVATMYSG
jgi:hypothetical protein